MDFRPTQSPEEVYKILGDMISKRREEYKKSAILAKEEKQAKQYLNAKKKDEQIYNFAQVLEAYEVGYDRYFKDMEGNFYFYDIFKKVFCKKDKKGDLIEVPLTTSLLYKTFLKYDYELDYMTEELDTDEVLELLQDGEKLAFKVNIADTDLQGTVQVIDNVISTDLPNYVVIPQELIILRALIFGSWYLIED